MCWYDMQYETYHADISTISLCTLMFETSLQNKHTLKKHAWAYFNTFYLYLYVQREIDKIWLNHWRSIQFENTYQNIITKFLCLTVKAKYFWRILTNASRCYLEMRYTNLIWFDLWLKSIQAYFVLVFLAFLLRCLCQDPLFGLLISMAHHMFWTLTLLNCPFRVH